MIKRIRSVLQKFSKPDAKSLAAQHLYIACVDAARHESFYTQAPLPDNVTTRLEMIMLHVALILLRLKTDAPRYDAASQALIEAFFSDMDRHFREVGIGDLKVGKRVRKLADLFYGRLAAYDVAFAQDTPEGASHALMQAIGRNVLREIPGAKEASAQYIASYAQQAWQMLSDTSSDKILAGDVHWHKTNE
jgi:cytochrome b pre-mRNA-processing protein 3